MGYRTNYCTCNCSTDCSTYNNLPKSTTFILSAYWIISAVCKKVQTGKITICAQQRGIVRIDETADGRIVITAGYIIELSLGIVDISTVAEGVMSAEGGVKGAGAVIAGGVAAPCVVDVGNDGCACAVQNSGDVTLEIGGVVIGSAVVGDGLGCAGRVVGEIQGVAVYIGDGDLVMIVLKGQLAAEIGNAAVRLHLIRQLR